MTGRAALVGATGFVGSNIGAQRPFDVLVHSRNQQELRGGVFEHVVFSAARAEKWRANADPEADRRHIAELVALLGSFSTRRLTLISTVDVFAEPRAVDEDSAVDVATQHQYGAGRHRLEQAARDLHADVLVVRLPALFGPGLKKNVLFDLVHRNALESIQPESSFQYYDIARLADDVDAAWDAHLDLVHLVTAPLTTASVVEQAFGLPPLPRSNRPVVAYDVRTRSAATFGGNGRHIEDAASVMGRLRAFVALKQAA